MEFHQQQYAVSHSKQIHEREQQFRPTLLTQDTQTAGAPQTGTRDTHSSVLFVYCFYQLFYYYTIIISSTIKDKLCNVQFLINNFKLCNLTLIFNYAVFYATFFMF